jgi:hypothetical protein
MGFKRVCRCDLIFTFGLLIDSNNNYEEKKRNNVIKISLNCQYANVINFCKTYKRNLDNLLNLFPITEGKATKIIIQ